MGQEGQGQGQGHQGQGRACGEGAAVPCEQGAGRRALVRRYDGPMQVQGPP